MQRSLQQHRSEWMYYRMIAEYTGHTPYEVYTILSRRFLLVIDENGGYSITKPTSLSTVEHNDYMERIRALMATEFDFVLPDPDASVFIENYVYKKLNNGE